MRHSIYESFKWDSQINPKRISTTRRSTYGDATAFTKHPRFVRDITQLSHPDEGELFVRHI